MTEDETGGWHHQLKGCELGQALRDGEGQEDLVCCSPRSREESDKTEQLNNYNTQLMDQGEISTFKSYSLRNVFHKAIEAIDSDSSHGSEQRQLQTFWREFTSLDAINNLCDSWEEVEITLTGVWKKLILPLMDDLRGVQDFSAGSNCRCGGNSKRTRIRIGG